MVFSSQKDILVFFAQVYNITLEGRTAATSMQLLAELHFDNTQTLLLTVLCFYCIKLKK